MAANNDNSDHDLRLLDEDWEATDLGVQHPGGAVRVTFATAGSFKIRCGITPDLRIAVTVN